MGDNNLKRLLILLLLISTHIRPVSGSNITRHIDPTQLTVDAPNPSALFNLYSNVYSYIATSNYQDALELIDTVKDINAPNNVETALNDYNQKLLDLVKELNQTELGINNAHDQLSWLRENLARDTLDTAQPHLEAANSSHYALESKSITLSNILNGSPTPLLSSREQVSQHINQLYSKITDGMNRVEQIELEKNTGLTETILSLSVNNSTPLLGSDITVTGTLTTISRETINGKQLVIQYPWASETRVTNENGRVQLEQKIPYIYSDSMKITATYRPNDLDNTTYTPTQTNLTINPTYYLPTISLQIPDTVHPSTQYSIQGNLTHNNKPLVSNLKLKAFNEEYNTTTSPNGDFTFYITIPDNVKNGLNRITIRSEASGIYAPNTHKASINVKRFPITITLEKKPWTLTGQNAAINGHVFFKDIPLENCQITVKLNNETILTETDSTGLFMTRFQVSILEPSLRNEITIYANPKEPWINQGSLSASHLVLNSLSIIAAIILLPLTLLINKKPEKDEKKTVTEKEATKEIVYPEREGLPGIYINALKVIDKLTGERINPGQTIYEFSESIKPHIITPIYSRFDQISRHYTRWYYGPEKENPPLKIIENLVKRMENETEKEQS